MAQVTSFVDDYTGKPLSKDEKKTVNLTYDGKRYSLDLSADSVEKLDKAISPFIANVTGTSTAVTSGSGSTNAKMTFIKNAGFNTIEEFNEFNTQNKTGVGEVKEMGRLAGTVERAWNKWVEENPDNAPESK